MGAPSAPPSCSSSPQCCCNGNYCFKGWTGIFSQPRLQTFIFQPVKMNENSFQILSFISYWPIAEWLSPDELSSVEFYTIQSVLLLLVELRLGQGPEVEGLFTKDKQCLDFCSLICVCICMCGYEIVFLCVRMREKEGKEKKEKTLRVCVCLVTCTGCTCARASLQLSSNDV